MKTKKRPIITEILLGKTVKEAIQEHFSEYNWESRETEMRLPEIIREIIRIDKNDLRFAVSVQSGSCCVLALNHNSKLLLLDNYWDEAGKFDFDDCAAQDCSNLNDIVERLYGTKRKRPEPKITTERFVEKKGKICPFCGSVKMVVVLDGITWRTRDEMGCRKCGETWDKEYKTVVTGFVG